MPDTPSYLDVEGGEDVQPITTTAASARVGPFQTTGDFLDAADDAPEDTPFDNAERIVDETQDELLRRPTPGPEPAHQSRPSSQPPVETTLQSDPRTPRYDHTDVQAERNAGDPEADLTSGLLGSPLVWLGLAGLAAVVILR
jgi:hypothetical protein